MPRLSLLTTLMLAGLASVAQAAQGDADAMVLSRDWQSRIGETVAITGCTITSATAEEMVCLIKSKHGGTAYFLIDPSGMGSQDVERALRDCSDYVGYPICRVRLDGEVGSVGDDLKILHGSVTWTD